MSMLRLTCHTSTILLFFTQYKSRYCLWYFPKKCKGWALTAYLTAPSCVWLASSLCSTMMALPKSRMMLWKILKKCPSYHALGIRNRTLQLSLKHLVFSHFKYRSQKKKKNWLVSHNSCSLTSFLYKNSKMIIISHEIFQFNGLVNLPCTDREKKWVKHFYSSKMKGFCYPFRAIR